MSVRGGGVYRLARMVWGTFFSTLPGGVRACQDGLGHFFPTFARLTEGGGCLKLFWQCLYRTNTFQKGASLTRAPPPPRFSVCILPGQVMLLLLLVLCSSIQWLNDLLPFSLSFAIMMHLTMGGEMNIDQK